jgi:hypothetical protein
VSDIVASRWAVCPLLSTAIYDGSRSTDNAKNYHCGGNLETKAAICDGLRTKYKHENGDRLDVRGVDGNDASCKIAMKHNDRDDDRDHGHDFDRDDRDHDHDFDRDDERDHDDR